MIGGGSDGGNSVANELKNEFNATYLKLDDELVEYCHVFSKQVKGAN